MENDRILLDYIQGNPMTINFMDYQELSTLDSLISPYRQRIYNELGSVIDEYVNNYGLNISYLAYV